MTTEHSPSAGLGTRDTSRGPTILDAGADHLIVINTYSVAPDRATELLDVLIRATEGTLRHVPGFISANFHMNLEHTQVVNYAQWRSPEALAAARDHPGVAERIAEAGKVANSFAPVQYRLQKSIFSAGS